MEVINVIGGIKAEPQAIKVEPEPVEIGIDDILDSSDEECSNVNVAREQNLQENQVISNEETENPCENVGSKETNKQGAEENENRTDIAATQDLQTGEKLVLNFGATHTKKQRAKITFCKSTASTDCSKELKEVTLTKASEESSRIEPHEYTYLAKNKHVCNHCQFTSNRKAKVFTHIRKMHRSNPSMNQCPYCPFKSKWDLRTHMIFKHKSDNEIEWFHCHHCDEKFKIKMALVRHMTIHLNTEQVRAIQVNCNICGATFKRKYNLDEHVKQIHNKEKERKLECKDCEYFTYKPFNLRQHIEVWHTDSQTLPVYKCDKCTYRTRIKARFNVHIKRHKTELMCELCGYKADSIEKLRLHLMTHKKKLSEKDLKFRCDRCDYKTYRCYSFEVHKLNHLKPEEIEYFYCYHCDFKAKRKDNLKTHVLRHFKKEEVKLQCYLCEFSSKKRSLLSNHIKKDHPTLTP